MSNVDRTKLNLVLANLVFNATADPTLRANVFSEIYDLLALRAAETDVLLKSNTTPYTPGASYNPSTKKYTDDAINAAITSVIGTPIIQTGTAFPTTPTAGQSFFKTDERRFYVYAASQWNASASLADVVGSQIYAYKQFGGL